MRPNHRRNGRDVHLFFVFLVFLVFLVENAEMGAELHVGCAMWSNRGWPGQSIPAATPRGGELEAYATVVNAVEGNTTFYATPRKDVAKGWAESVPPDFRFMFKLPRSVTHERKLRGVDDEVRTFLLAMEPCHPMMDPVAVQLPATFGPDSLDALDQFLRSSSSAFRWAVEVRHPAFFDGADAQRRLNDLLFDRGADRIILDSRSVFAGPRETPAEHEAFENKPRLPVLAVATNDRPVVRFIGQTKAEGNPPFWEPWIETVVRWIGDGRRPIVFIHTPDNLVAPALCRQFHAEVAARVPGMSELPEPPPIDMPRLFD